MAFPACLISKAPVSRTNPLSLLEP